MNEDVALIVHRKLLKLRVYVSLSLDRFCLVGVDLSFREFARPEAATVRLANGLAPLVEFVVSLRSDWRVSIDVVAIVQAVV